MAHEDKAERDRETKGIKQRHAVKPWEKWIVPGIAVLSVFISYGLIFVMMKKTICYCKKEKKNCKKKVKKQSEFAEVDLAKPEKLEELEEF